MTPLVLDKKALRDATEALLKLEDWSYSPEDLVPDSEHSQMVRAVVTAYLTATSPDTPNPEPVNPGQGTVGEARPLDPAIMRDLVEGMEAVTPEIERAIQNRQIAAAANRYAPSLSIWRDCFAEITAKAVPYTFDPNDPERILSYVVPAGPIHRAAGKTGFQFFGGEEAARQWRERADTAEATIRSLKAERDKWFAEAEDRANSCSLVMRERDALKAEVERVTKERDVARLSRDSSFDEGVGLLLKIKLLDAKVTAFQAERDAMADALREVIRAHDDNSGAEPSLSVFDRAIDEAHALLTHTTKAGLR